MPFLPLTTEEMRERESCWRFFLRLFWRSPMYWLRSQDKVKDKIVRKGNLYHETEKVKGTR